MNVDALVKKVALVDCDDWWQSRFSNSLLGRLTTALRKLMPNSLPAAGTILQQLSYAGVVVLFAILALEKFANDKDMLALLALACAAVWMLGYVIGGTEKRQTVSIDILIWLYLAVNIVATASSHYLHESIHGLLKVAVYIATYFLFTTVLQQSTQRKFGVLAVLLAASLYVCAVGFYQYIHHVAPLATWEDPSVENQGTRIFSTLRNPNLLAGYLIPLAPLAASIGVCALIQARKKTLFGLAAMAAFGAAGLLSIATVLTQSRGGFIGLAAALGSFMLMILADFWRSHPSKRIWVGLACFVLPVMAVLAAHFAVPTFDQRVMSIFSGTEHSSNAYRFAVYSASLKMLKDNWWIGVGPGNQAFVQAYGLYMRSRFEALGTYCVPLEVAVEAGIVALASFICLVFSVLARGHICFWSQTSSQNERWLAAGSSAALLGMMAQGLSDTVFYRPQVQFLFWLLIALLVGCRHADKNHRLKAIN